MDRGRGRSRETDVHPTRVYTYRLRSILRRRWTDYLVLTLVVAVLGGLAMGSVVVGRRTQSSFASFLARDKASTLTMSTYGTTPDSTANAYVPAVAAAIRRLPEVQSVEAWVGGLAYPIAADGAPLPAANNSVNIAASVDGLYFDQDRATVVQGRAANPNSPSEFVTSALGARLLGVHLGQEVPFGTFTIPMTEQPGFGTAAVQPLSRTNLRLVGIVEYNGQLVQDDSDRLPTNLVLTPAFTRTLPGVYGTWYGIKLRPGVGDVAAVERKVVALLPPGSAPNFSFESTVQSRMEAALRPESIALGGFGLIAALAVLGILIPVLARIMVSGEHDRRVLRALGASPRSVAADSAVGPVTALTAGVVLALPVSMALSLLAPLGPLHRLYHPSSLAPDWTVVGAGAALFAGVLGAVSVTMAVRSAETVARRLHPEEVPVSRVAVAARTAGLPVPVVVGARFALEPGRGRTAVPARSVIGGAMVSVALVVATLTFASGLRTLASRPTLYGWDWSYALLSYTAVPPPARAALTADPLVQGWSGYNAVNFEIDGREIPGLGAADTAVVGPPILSGHEVTGPNQVVLGRATLESLHKKVGDLVQFGYGSPSTAPLYLPPRPMRIVGTATFPALAGSSTFADHTSMGVGALMSYLSLPASFRSLINSPDPIQDGPALVFVRYKPRVAAKTAIADLNRIVGVANRAFAADPAAVGDSVSWEGVQRPAAIVNYQSTGGTPLILALALALGAMAALALSLVASVRRRRRDLAVLKALGFTRSQTTATVAAQGLVTAVLAVAVGVPVGVAAGRQLWIAFARSIDAVPAPTVPASVAVVAIAAIVIAVAVAVVPGRLAAATPAAAVLRAD